jgi:Protein of unknown function (DUF4011)/REase_MTES_1575/AAA domain
MNPSPSTSTSVQERIIELFEQARKKLLDTGARNKLVHTPRDDKRSKSIAIIGENSDEVFHTLVVEEKAFSFLPSLDARSDDEASDGLLVALPPEVSRANDGRRDTQLQTRLPPERLQRRLLRLFRDAKTLEEEQGVNSLFLALGFLRWYESESSDIVREAPLILIPVNLVRNSARSSFRITLRDDDISTNISLQERMREFGVTLPEVPEGPGWTPDTYFDAASSAVSNTSRWSVDRNGMMLGFFSFSKLMMFRDLMPENWPGESILQHPLLNDILVGDTSTEPPLFSDSVPLDETFDPAQLMHVVDADASQALVIETVRAGRSLVVQGPPGTGKSQTIANIIAAAIFDKKTVLFVAEKMAALEVVYDRLQKSGLGDACFELHSRQANKRAVLQELERTLRSPSVPTSVSGDVDRLRKLRNDLNACSALLHKELLPSKTTPYRALGQLVKLGAEGHQPPTLSLPGAAAWSESQTREIVLRLQELTSLTTDFGPKDQHPWNGITTVPLQPPDIARLAPLLQSLAADAKVFADTLTRVREILGLRTELKVRDIEPLFALLRDIAARPALSGETLRALANLENMDLVRPLLEAGVEFLTIWSSLNGAFLNGAWQFDFTNVRTGLVEGATSWTARLRSPYRTASRELQICLAIPLPKLAAERIRLVDLFEQARTLRRHVDSRKDFAIGVFGESWTGLRTDFKLLMSGVDWVSNLSSATIGADTVSCISFSEGARKLLPLLEARWTTIQSSFTRLLSQLSVDTRIAFEADDSGDVKISAMADRIQAWSESLDRIHEWPQLVWADSVVREDGIDVIADALARGELIPEKAVKDCLYARAEALWKQAINENANLAKITGDQRSRWVSEFRLLETARRTAVSREINAVHRASVPAPGPLLSGEFVRRRGQISIRKLMKVEGQRIQEIKPVFLMSPLSIAQYLPPGSLEFDLLVIDEASQVKPEDAMGAIARSRQLVVVGDKKQLPPTSFFDRVVDDLGDEDEDDTDQPSNLTAAMLAAKATQLESILSACEVRGMPGRMLSWHYRSKHPSLIEVSNSAFYNNQLFLPPSPHAARGKMGLILTPVNGAYDRGGKRTNEVEAKAVVEAVVKHIVEQPELSLGIVTFSISQRELIEDFLEVRRREIPDLESFMQRTDQEPLFIKNLENVQGDERDVIFISIGYGPRIAGSGLDSMSFGPVSSDGGERRLNVLFTRARFRTEVFSSFSSSDIDLARAKTEGARMLKRFLHYAETGHIGVPEPTGGGYDSPFEEAVAKAIEEFGHRADSQVGSAGFKIDLAVLHPAYPGRYILAVECDGAAYHSARWARERDRLRQEILEQREWSFHRIWSTDWFRNPKGEKAKLLEAIEKAKIRHSN